MARGAKYDQVISLLMVQYTPREGAHSMRRQKGRTLSAPVHLRTVYRAGPLSGLLCVGGKALAETR